MHLMVIGGLICVALIVIGLIKIWNKSDEKKEDSQVRRVKKRLAAKKEELKNMSKISEKLDVEISVSKEINNLDEEITTLEQKLRKIEKGS